MAEEIRHPDGRIEHPSVRHEESDANFRWILGIILGAMVFAAIVQYGVLVFFQESAEHQAKTKRSPFPLAPNPSESLPRTPRLEQLDRLAAIQRSSVYLRQKTKEAVLNSYGPTPEKGFVHIPIDRAMKLLEKKLPSRSEKANSEQRANGLIDAGESNSGRLFQRRPQWHER